MAQDGETAQEKNFQWGDEEDDEFLSAEESRFETAPDAKGVKTITDIQVRNGKKIKITKKVRIVKKSIRVNTRAEERARTWVPFGKAKENSTEITVKEQDVPFDISGKQRPAASLAQKKIDEEINKMMRQSANKAAGLDATDKYIPKSLRPGGRAAPEPAKSAAEPANTYRPPSMRDGTGAGARAMAGRADDGTYTVRVTNLSDDITEQDLRDLFSVYGPLQRVFLAKDRVTRESKGFAFINYFNRADAEKAIEKVTGFGFRHLILKVEWARPANN